MPGISALPHVDFLEQLPYSMAISEFQDDKPQLTSTYGASAWGSGNEFMVIFNPSQLQI